MRLTRIELKNFMPFRGSHELALEAKAYAVVARRKDNAEASNWCGKSALLEAVYFALTGRLNRDRHLGADGWITNGEREGFVVLQFDDGTVVERERKKTTQLTVSVRGESGTVVSLKKEEAQHMLDGIVGLGADDLVATCYFQQRKMARLVLAEPKERMDYVAGWLRLGPLERGEELVREGAAKLSFELSDLVQRHRTATSAAETMAALEEQEAALDKVLAEARTVVNIFQVLLEKVGVRERAAGAASEYEGVVKEGKELRARVDAMESAEFEAVLNLQEELVRVADAEYVVVSANARQKAKLAHGKFDGHCPVAELQCPVVAEINAQRERNAELAEKAEAERRESNDKLNRVMDARRKARQDVAGLERARGELQVLRARAMLLMEAMEAAGPGRSGEINPEEVRQKFAAARAAVEEAAGKLERVKYEREVARKAAQEAEACEARLAKVEAALSTHREAALIFGKNGAQRRLAEHVLARVEDGANDLLRECGIALEVQVRWAREGEGLAKACESCGYPYPASARVKECARCGAQRGPHVVNRLDIVLSDQSGAAEDLAGAAVQLSAGAWLRADRGSAWSVALLDEPFGAMDAANRKAFSAHLAAMLGGRYGFSQSLTVAHHSSVLDALPGRIEIVAGPEGSVARVVA